MGQSSHHSKPPTPRYQIVMALCIPLAYGFLYFLLLCRQMSADPDKYLDSPASALVYFFYLALFVVPSVLGIIIVLLTRRKKPS